MVERKSIPALVFISIEVVCIGALLFGLFMLFSPLWFSGGGISKYFLEQNGDFPILNEVFTFVFNTVTGIVIVVVAGLSGLWAALAAGIVSFVKAKHAAEKQPNANLPIKDIERFE